MVDFSYRQLVEGDFVRRLHPADGTSRANQPTGPRLRVTKVDYRDQPAAWLDDGTWEYVEKLFLEQV